MSFLIETSQQPAALSHFTTSTTPPTAAGTCEFKGVLTSDFVGSMDFSDFCPCEVFIHEESKLLYAKVTAGGLLEYTDYIGQFQGEWRTAA